MKLFLSLSCLLSLQLTALVSAQDESNYPVATPTDKPNVVISPYDPDHFLDVTGIEPGTLAEDPYSGKFFRVPFSNPTERYYDVNPEEDPFRQPNADTPPPRRDPVPPRESAPNSTDRSFEPSWTPDSSSCPPELVQLIDVFNQSSGSNDPDELLNFYAERVDDYFGRKNLSRAAIRKDRVAYIKRYPKREYVLEGEPVLLSSDGRTHEVMARVRYSVRNTGRPRTGSVSHRLTVTEKGGEYWITSIREMKAGAAPKEVRQKDARRNTTDDLASRPGSPYGRYEEEHIALFLDAFAASGEVNEPSANIDFMHPQMTRYYGMKNPERSALLKDRRNYIARWPSRRYWLTDKPRIRKAARDSWEVVSSIGYQVKNGSKVRSGVAKSVVALTNTAQGLKITSINERK
ncbi:MAG: hypothetical protein AAF514_19960 [Verrucomicrobiota bacterium]